MSTEIRSTKKIEFGDSQNTIFIEYLENSEMAALLLHLEQDRCSNVSARGDGPWPEGVQLHIGMRDYEVKELIKVLQAYIDQKPPDPRGLNG